MDVAGQYLVLRIGAELIDVMLGLDADVLHHQQASKELWWFAGKVEGEAPTGLWLKVDGLLASRKPASGPSGRTNPAP